MIYGIIKIILLYLENSLGDTMSEKTLVFRFSDGNYDTIEEHKIILKKYNLVYWGWWKKDFETFDYTPDFSSKKKYIDIWLVNRRKGEFFVARCKYIINTANKTYSPNVDKTPEYYSDMKFNVWLELHSIEKKTKEEYLSNYREIPSGDKTFFLLEKAVIPYKNILDTVTIEGDSILHISDLHFGEFHNYKSSRNPTRTLTLLKKIINTVKKYKIGLIVVSGDFTTKANEDGFSQSKEFLESLCKECGVDKKNLVLVPGNHDISIKDDKDIEENKAENSFQNQYRKFRYDLMNVSESENLYYIKAFEMKNKILTFSAFNSNRILDKVFKDHGFVGADNIDPLLDELSFFFSNLKKDSQWTFYKQNLQKEYIKNNIINFCVLHHNLKLFMPTPSIDPEKPRTFGVLLDGGEFESKILTAGIHFMLHGHQHLPYHGTSGIFTNDGERLNLNILGAGSIGSKIGIGGGYPDDFPYNSFNIYTLEDDFLRMNVFKYTHKLKIDKTSYVIPYI